MKILLSTTNLEIGGAQLFVLHLASALSETHTVYLYDHRPEDRNRQFVKSNISKKVKILSYASHLLLLKIIWKINKTILQLGINFHFRDYLNTSYFKKVIQKYKPEIIHSHIALSDITVARYKGSIPFVVTLHGCYDIDRTSIHDEYYQNAVKNIPFLVKKINALIYLSEKSLTEFRPFLNERNILIKKIYNGFNFIGSPVKKSDIRKRFHISKSALIFVMVARGYKEKGWEEAIQAFMHIQGKSSLETYLFLISDSAYLQNLKLKHTHIKNIIFFGNVAEPLEIIAGADVGILPSYRECLPNSIVEYLYCGLPVIATNVGEIELMLTYNNMKAGILIELLSNGKPDIDALSNTMLCYIEHPEMRKQHAEIAKNAAEKFSMQRCVEAHITLYNLLSAEKIH